MKTYSLRHLGALGNAPNFGAIVERIDVAATKAAFIMRNLGLSLPGVAFPLLDDVDVHLRKMVTGAIDDMRWNESGVDGTVGDSFDDHFDVQVTRNPDDSVDVDIYMRLV